MTKETLERAILNDKRAEDVTGRNGVQQHKASGAAVTKGAQGFRPDEAGPAPNRHIGAENETYPGSDKDPNECAACLTHNASDKTPQRCNPCPRGIDFENTRR
jgi:hypothetical protein